MLLWYYLMMGYRIKFAIGEFYHIYNRGVDKRVIFDDHLDYQRFLLLMLLANDTSNVDLNQSFRDFSIPELIILDRNPIVCLGAFSLMPNHFHFVLSELAEGSITSFMRKVATGYSMYFNMKNERTGTLFQGRYKAKHLNSDNYLRYIYQYIHLNKVRDTFDSADQDSAVDLIKIAESDPYNSFSVYSGKEKGRLSESVVDTDMMYKVYVDYSDHIKNLLQWKESALYYKEQSK